MSSASALRSWLGQRPSRPGFIIGGAEHPYLRRWWVIPRNRWLNVYLHHFMRSDDDRALHDHPWWNCSILLRGSYIEVTPRGKFVRKPGHIYFRKATAAHRVMLFAEWRQSELWPGGIEKRELPVWTLFITGRKVRDWGFLCPQGWRPWQTFTSQDGATVGRGCEEWGLPGDQANTPEKAGVAA